MLNRHRFESELTRVTAEVRRYRRRASLLELDLDGFKEVNDRFGHPVGDELIIRIGALLRAHRAHAPTSSPAWAATSSS